MTAVAGLFRRNGSGIITEQLGEMLGYLGSFSWQTVRRWTDDSIALGVVARDAVDASERLVVSPSRQLAITADARLDNRLEIREALGLRRLGSPIQSDSRLILEAYGRWGEASIGRLVGDFAFVIWDGRRRRVICGRDAFGVRPLYFSAVSDQFAVSSSIRALLGLAGVERRLNEDRLADYLANHVEETGETLFAGVSSLPGGHALIVDDSGFRIEPYWNPQPRALGLRSDEEYAEAFRALFTEAVRCRLPASGPVGSLLSGGLDSSSATCVARDLLGQRGQPLHTFTALYDRDPTCDERRYSQAVISAGGVLPHLVYPERLSPLAAWPGRAAADDEPAWNPQVAIHRVIYDAAREAGVETLLEGFGGDDIVSHGFAYLSELIGGGHWLGALSQARALSRSLQAPLITILRRRGAAPFAPQWALRVWRQRRYDDSAWAFGMPLQRDFAQRVRMHARLERARDSYRPARSVREEHRRDLVSSLWGVQLATSARIAALHGIDARYPFFDRRLAEFCLSLPGDQKLRDGNSRIIVRHALAGILPETVRLRPGKANLAPSFSTGLREGDARLVEQVLQQPGRLAMYVDAGRLRAVWTRFLGGGSEEDAMTIWRAVTLACWLDAAFPGAAESRPLVAAAAGD